MTNASERLQILNQRPAVDVGADSVPETVPTVPRSRSAGIEPVARRTGRRIIVYERLSNAFTIEPSGGPDGKRRGAFRDRPEEMMQGGHAAVVEVWVVRPHARERRGRVPGAFREPAFGCERAAIEGSDKLG